MPIFWECDRCTACCRWPGQVGLSGGEIARIAGVLALDEAAFINEYTRVNRSRTGLALKERDDGSCVFLDGTECRIQAVKPQQCRDFPNLWNFPGFEAICRAKPTEVEAAEWRRRVLAATGRSAEPPR